MEIVKMGRLLARCTNWMRLSRGSAGWVMMALLLALLGLLVIQTINWPGQEGGSFVPTWRDMTGRINRNQISPQGISDRGKIKSRQDDDDGEIVYQSDYPVSSDVFVSLLKAWPLSLLLPLAWTDLPPSPCQAGASLCFCSSNEMEKSFNVYCPDPAHTELTITLRQHSAPVISFTWRGPCRYKLKLRYFWSRIIQSQ